MKNLLNVSNISITPKIWPSINCSMEIDNAGAKSDSITPQQKLIYL